MGRLNQLCYHSTGLYMAECMSHSCKPVQVKPTQELHLTKALCLCLLFDGLGAKIGPASMLQLPMSLSWC